MKLLNVFKRVLNLTTCMIFFGYGFSINADKITVINKSPNPLWVYIKKLGAAGDDASVKDTTKTIDSGKSLAESGNIPGIWVLPSDQVKKGMSDDQLRNEAEKKNLYQRLGHSDWIMSFAVAKNKKAYLYFGTSEIDKPFSFIETSDTHPIGKSFEDVQKMSMDHYAKYNDCDIEKINKEYENKKNDIEKNEKDEKKKQSKLDEAKKIFEQKKSDLEKLGVKECKKKKDDEKRKIYLGDFTNQTAYFTCIQKHILDPKNSIAAVILNGDNAGGYGKKSELEAFLERIYKPLQGTLSNPNRKGNPGGYVFYGFGNHDTYWTSVIEPAPAALEWVKKTYGDYIYAFNIGQVRFISLGLHPTSWVQRVALGEKAKNSLKFLQSELSRLDNDQPVVIYFHFPIHDHGSDDWSKKEKDAFYDAIKDHNILVIMVGHSHGTDIWKFRDKFSVVKSAYAEGTFSQCTFDPQQPQKIDIKFFRCWDYTKKKATTTEQDITNNVKIKKGEEKGLSTPAAKDKGISLDEVGK